MARIPMFVDGVSTNEMPMMLDTNQAAAILNVTPRTVTRMCEQGKLKAVRVMSLWRINRDALLESCGLLGGGEE